MVYLHPARLTLSSSIKGTIETIFMVKKTFHLVEGLMSWSEKPYFHTNGGKVASESRNVRKNLFFKQLYMGN